VLLSDLQLIASTLLLANRLIDLTDNYLKIHLLISFYETTTIFNICIIGFLCRIT
jgi:hypothetical protein